MFFAGAQKLIRSFVLRPGHGHELEGPDLPVARAVGSDILRSRCRLSAAAGDLLALMQKVSAADLGGYSGPHIIDHLLALISSEVTNELLATFSQRD